MFEFVNIFVAIIEMFIKKIFNDEKLFAMTTFAKKFEKNNIYVFERIDFNFNVTILSTRYKFLQKLDL